MMRVEIKGGAYKVLDYSFSSPTTGAIRHDIESNFFFCLDTKTAICLTYSDGDIDVSTYKIKLQRNALYIDYCGRGKYEKAGPITQEKYKTAELERAVLL